MHVKWNSAHSRYSAHRQRQRLQRQLAVALCPRFRPRFPPGSHLCAEECVCSLRLANSQAWRAYNVINFSVNVQEAINKPSPVHARELYCAPCASAGPKTGRGRGLGQGAVSRAPPVPRGHTGGGLSSGGGLSLASSTSSRRRPIAREQCCTTQAAMQGRTRCLPPHAQMYDTLKQLF